uniref:Uncharacterized protein n=1 Tax=Arundo donax TaxID=35708 RepID=A0A0A9GMK6_ARUDO
MKETRSSALEESMHRRYSPLYRLLQSTIHLGMDIPIDCYSNSNRRLINVGYCITVSLHC